MRMIRAVAIMLTLTVTITLVGCVSYVDLSDRAIVQAIGIDYLPDKKVYRISMQYFNQSSEGGQNQIDKTQDNVLKSVGEGESVKSNMVYTLCKHMVYMLSIINEHKK